MVDQDAFDKAFSAAEYWIAGDMLRRNGFLTYNEINALCSNDNFCGFFRRQIEELFSAILSAGIAYLTATALFALPFIASTGQQGSHSGAITENATVLEHLTLCKLSILDARLTKLNEAGKKFQDPELITVDYSDKHEQSKDSGEKASFWLPEFYWMNNVRRMAEKSENLTSAIILGTTSRMSHFAVFSMNVIGIKPVCY